MTENAFIEPEILAALGKRSLFYPAAGSDWSELVHVFADHVSEFCFADIAYDFRRGLAPPFADATAYRLVVSEFDGDRRARIEQRQTDAGGSYRFVEPARLTELFERLEDGRLVTVIRRRRFGEYALAEFPDHSIGVFVHRGDSPGEGGSDVYFLANRKRAHEPCSKLFDKLTTKLADHALIVSDGSNARPRFLRKFHRSSISGVEAHARLCDEPFSFGVFEWTCVGYLSARNGPTLVWHVVRREWSAARTPLPG